MFSKLIITSLLTLNFSSVIWASTEKLKCADQAVQAATESSYKQFKASGGSCGAKLLTAGDFNETYLVCISDETDPSEWVVVIEKKSQATKKLAARDCVVKYAGVQYDSQTPHFESEEGLLKTKECSVSDNGKGTSKVTCQ